MINWRRLANRLGFSLLVIAGAMTWLWVGAYAVLIVWMSAVDPDPHIVWLYDWHVYAAGAADLVARDLYQVPLTFPGWPLPVDTYNLPPFSAALAVPLSPLEDEAAGIAWIAISAVVWASSWWATLTLVGIRHAWAWTGIGLAGYSVAFYWWGANVLLGNVNHLVLGMLCLFAIAYAQMQSRWSGIALGLAIATKLWPVVLIVPLVRERRFATVGWALGTAGITTGMLVLWLGPRAIIPMLEALALQVPIEPGVPVLWTSAFRVAWEWWPAWGGVATGVALLLLPLRGLTGFGVAIIGGISIIPNIWDHYLPTLIVAVVLVVVPIWKQSRLRDPFHVEARSTNLSSFGVRRP